MNRANFWEIPMKCKPNSLFNSFNFMKPINVSISTTQYRTNVTKIWLYHERRWNRAILGQDLYMLDILLCTKTKFYFNQNDVKPHETYKIFHTRENEKWFYQTTEPTAIHQTNTMNIICLVFRISNGIVLICIWLTFNIVSFVIWK